MTARPQIFADERGSCLHSSAKSVAYELGHTANNHLLAGKDIFNTIRMSKSEILDELPKLTKTERQEIRLRLAELDSDDWLDDEEPLTVQERALLDPRLA